MAKKKLNKIYCKQDDLVHIKPNGSHDPAETLCYKVDTFDDYEVVFGEKVTCANCRLEFDSLKNGLALET